jgi:hypothetical protein
MRDEQTRTLRAPCEHGHYDYHVTHYDTMGQVVGECESWREIVEQPVPWCETHDSPMKDGVCDWVWGNQYNVEPVECRLHHPPKVWRER